MKEKLAEKIKKIALKAARKSVGKSFPIGVYEPEIPQELIREIRREKMDELKQLFKKLLIIVQQYGDSSYNPQKEILKRIINDMESVRQFGAEYIAGGNPAW